MMQTNTQRPAWGKALVLGLLLAAMIAASLMLAAESAHADTTFTVDTTIDRPDLNIGDGACDIFTGGGNECSLRAAIQEANATFGQDTVNFNISGAGVKTISPRSELPAITEAVTIDGYSQSGAKENTLAQRASNANLLIQLDGEFSGPGTDGLVIRGSDVVVRGLIINNFRDSGVRIESSGADGNKLEGNFIGTDPTGTEDVGNANDGVSLGGGASAGGGSDNLIGGPDPAARNVISGNENFGVRLFSGSVSASNNTIEGNLIGTHKDGASALGNGDEGVSIAVFASDNTVSANTIAFNGGAGLAISKFKGNGELRGNRIQFNSIFSNEDLGIDLGKDGKTANDDGPPPDADAGPNDLQNFPVLNSATNSGRLTTVEGDIKSTPNKSFAIEFFSNPRGEDEGEKFLGQRIVTTDAAGKANFEFVTSLTVPAGQAVTATATNTAIGNTSEFSEAVTVDNGPPPPPPPPSNVAPVATDDARKAKEGKTLNVPAPGVLANDFDADGDPLTAQFVSDPAKGTLTFNADGSFSYTPFKKFKGTDSFTYRVSDGKGGTSEAQVTITVKKKKKE